MSKELIGRLHELLRKFPNDPFVEIEGNMVKVVMYQNETVEQFVRKGDEWFSFYDNGHAEG